MRRTGTPGGGGRPEAIALWPSEETMIVRYIILRNAERLVSRTGEIPSLYSTILRYTVSENLLSSQREREIDSALAPTGNSGTAMLGEQHGVWLLRERVGVASVPDSLGEGAPRLVALFGLAGTRQGGTPLPSTRFH